MGSEERIRRRPKDTKEHPKERTKERRSFVAAFSFVSFVSFVSFLSAQDAWPQFRGSPRLTGAPGESPAARALKWTSEAGETTESSAAIADGVVYVGAGDGNLLGIGLASGKLRGEDASGKL